jgi:sugar phosphate isomerase/epimerase
MLPFRIGTTSFIRPAGWAENVERLGATVEDVELLFFEGESDADLPSHDEIVALGRLKEEHGLSYTVHTPLHAQLASPDRDLRVESVKQILRVVRLCEPLEPFAYVVHVYFGAQENDPSPPADLEAWKSWARDGLGMLVDATGIPERLCAESLDYDLVLLEDVLDEFGLSVALDVGHMARDGREISADLVRFLARTRVVHWHGTDRSGRDHRSLEHFPLAQGRRLLQILKDRRFDGVLTLEVFRPDDWESSRRVVRELLGELT